MTPGAEIKPGRHCRKASVPNTRPTLPPKRVQPVNRFYILRKRVPAIRRGEGTVNKIIRKQIQGEEVVPQKSNVSVGQ